MSQIALLADEVKKLRMENTSIATILMRKEKAQGQEVEDWIRRQEAVKEAQEKKEQKYAEQIKQMEAGLKKVLEGMKAEQSRRVLVETQLQAQMEAVPHPFPA